MKCTFCNSNIPKGTGKMFVKNTGEIFYFDKYSIFDQGEFGKIV